MQVRMTVIVNDGKISRVMMNLCLKTKISVENNAELTYGLPCSPTTMLWKRSINAIRWSIVKVIAYTKISGLVVRTVKALYSIWTVITFRNMKRRSTDLSAWDRSRSLWNCLLNGLIQSVCSSLIRKLLRNRIGFTLMKVHCYKSCLPPEIRRSPANCFRRSIIIWWSIVVEKHLINVMPKRSQRDIGSNRWKR